MPESRAKLPPDGPDGAQASPERISINILPAELLGKILSHLNDAERCDVAPLVSKSWLRIHKDFPPHRETWHIPPALPVTQPMVGWLVRIAGSLEELFVCSADPHVTCSLPQLLAVAAVAAPKLRQLVIARLGAAQPVLRSLGLLGNLRVLAVRELELRGTGIACLSALHQLEAIGFEESHLAGAEQEQADQLWKALSKVKNLSEVSFNDDQYQDIDDDEWHPYLNEGLHHGVHAELFRSISQLTQIRSLELALSSECLVDGLSLHDSFTGLVSLTSFESRNFHPGFAFPAALGLPRLAQLAVGKDPVLLRPGDFVVESEYLTYLSICGCGNSSVSDILPAVTPALPNLRVLSLRKGLLEDFPASVASRLSLLCELDLSRNVFNWLPPAVLQIPTLRKLDMSQNRSLQLDAADVMDMTRLTLLCLEKQYGHSEEVWSAESVQAIVRISQVCPGLEVRT